MNLWRRRSRDAACPRPTSVEVGIAIATLVWLTGCATPTTGECALKASRFDRYECMNETIFGADSRARRSAIASSVFAGVLSFGIGESRTVLQGLKKYAQTDVFFQNQAVSVDQAATLYVNDKKVRLGTTDVRKLLSEIQADLAADNRRLANLARASTDLLAEDSSALRGTGPTDESVKHQAQRLVTAGNVQQMHTVYRTALQRAGSDLAADVRSRDLLAELQEILTSLQKDAAAGSE